MKGNGSTPRRGASLLAEAARVEREQLTRELMVVGGPSSLYTRRGTLRDDFDPPDTVISGSADASFRLYQQMREDPFVKAAVRQLKFGVLSLPVEVRAGGDAEADARNRDFAWWALDNMSMDLWTVLHGALESLDMGFSVAELVYRVQVGGPWSGKLTLDRIKGKDPESLGFELDDFNNILAVKQRGQEERRFPPDKFLIVTWLGRYGSPWGTAEFRGAYRAWFIKRVLMRLRALHAERNVVPVLRGTVPEGTPREVKDALMEMLEEVQHNSRLVHDDNIGVTALDIAATRTSEWRDFLQDLNQEIVIGITGAFLQMMEGARTGARATGEVHVETAGLTYDAVRAALADRFTTQVLARLVRLNFPDGEIPYLAWTKKDDLAERRATDDFLVNRVGLRLDEDYWYALYDRPRPAAGAAVPTPPALAAAGVRLAEARGGSAFWRPLRLAEEPSRNDVRARGRFFDDHQAATLEAMRGGYAALFDGARAAAAAAYDARGTKIDPRKLDLAVLDPAPLRGVLRRALLVARGRGARDALALVTRRNLLARAKDAGLRTAGRPSVLAVEAPHPVALAAAPLPVGPAGRQEAFEALARSVALTREDFDALLARAGPEAARLAFTVAGLELEQIRSDVQRLAVRALQEGWSLDRFQVELDAASVRYVEPVYARAGTVGEKVLDFHAEMVFRTNAVRAYDDGRADAMRDPVVRDLLPGQEFSAILDDRSTLFCRAHDGFRRPTTDPVWEDLLIPSHFNSVVAGTRVTTRAGAVPVEGVHRGDWVLTHRRHWRRVYDVMAKPNDTGGYVEVTTASGRRLRATGEHPVLTRRGWVRADQLVVGDEAFECHADRLGAVAQSEGVVADTEDAIAQAVCRGRAVLVAHDAVLGAMPEAIDLYDHTVIEQQEVHDGVIDDDLRGSAVAPGREQPCGIGLGERWMSAEPPSERTDHAPANLVAVHGIVRTHGLATSFVESSGFSGRGGAGDDRWGMEIEPGEPARGRGLVAVGDPMAPQREGQSVHARQSELACYGSQRHPSAEVLLLDHASEPSGVVQAGMAGAVVGLAHGHASYVITIELSIVAAVHRREHVGMVHNLAVEEDETYFADGILVHNCRSLILPIDFLDWTAESATKERPAIQPQEGFGRGVGAPFS